MQRREQKMLPVFLKRKKNVCQEFFFLGWKVNELEQIRPSRHCQSLVSLSNCQNIFFTSTVRDDVKTTFANDSNNNKHGSREMTKMGSKVNELDTWKDQEEVVSSLSKEKTGSGPEIILPLVCDTFCEVFVFLFFCFVLTDFPLFCAKKISSGSWPLPLLSMCCFWKSNRLQLNIMNTEKI